MRKHIFYIGILAALFAASGAVLGAESRPLEIGFVDLSKVAEQSILKQKLEDDIETLARNKNREGLERRGKIDDLKKASLLLEGQALADKQNEIRQMEFELRQFAEEIRREINARRVRASRMFLKALKTVIEQVGKADGYDYIFSDEVVLFRSSGDDITEKVIERLNAQYATLAEDWANEAPSPVQSDEKE